MERELIVNSAPSGVRIALLENKKLVELHEESEGEQFRVGDIYLGKIQKLNPGLNAAFINVGYKRDAFLHYTDLGPNFRSLNKYTQQAIRGQGVNSSLSTFKLEPEIIKTGKINQVTSKNHTIMVQVLKEPISTKGPRLTCEISLPGRFIVLTPFNTTIGVSRRILSSDERKRLQRLLESIVPKNFGVIVRTVAEGKSVSVLHEDLTDLLEQWKQISRKLKSARPPRRIFTETKKTNTIIRDLLNESFNKVITNDVTMRNSIKEYIKKIAPEKEKIVSVYNSSKPIFDTHDITRQIKISFGKNVSVESGAYLVIEHTEALHVIDINSGPKISLKGDQDQNAFQVNRETAYEVARQLRLRDLGGIIIVDFIDMKKTDNKKAIYQVMKEAMKDDRAKHSILQISRFGLMQITRQRVRPEINITTNENCPTCLGTGKIQASLPLIDQIESRIKLVFSNNPGAKIVLICHPFVEAYLKKGMMSIQVSWFKQFRKWIKVYKNADYHIMEYHFFDENEEEIEVNDK